MRMVHIRRMRMRVTQSPVLVDMGMRLAGRVHGAVLVLVMVVVDMRMGMGQRRMDVLMLVTLGQVQPDAGRHQRARDGELRGHRLAECDDRNGAAQKRRG